MSAMVGQPVGPDHWCRLSFSHRNAFEVGDIVVVGRSEGGLKYAKLVGVKTSAFCPLDLNKQRKGRVRGWNVMVDAGVVKLLPTLGLGKLVPPAQNPNHTAPAPPVPLHTTSWQLAGGGFDKGDRVVVPRTHGGFSLATVEQEEEVDQLCPFCTNIHPHKVWRVLLEGGGKKLLPTLLCGRILPHTSSTAPSKSQPPELPPVPVPVAVVPAPASHALLPVPLPSVGPHAPSVPSTTLGAAAGSASLPHVRPLSMPDDSPQALAVHDKPVVILDAPNIAIRHGNDATFSCEGIEIALAHFDQLGLHAIGILPEYYLNPNRRANQRKPQHTPTNIALLQRLKREHRLFFTPPQDYDDSYTIAMAKRMQGYICTNDRYNDHISKQKSAVDRERERQWVRSHCVSFTWVGDIFLPNPDFHFPVPRAVSPIPVLSPPPSLSSSQTQPTQSLGSSGSFSMHRPGKRMRR